MVFGPIFEIRLSNRTRKERNISDWKEDLSGGVASLGRIEFAERKLYLAVVTESPSPTACTKNKMLRICSFSSASCRTRGEGSGEDSFPVEEGSERSERRKTVGFRRSVCPTSIALAVLMNLRK